MNNLKFKVVVQLIVIGVLAGLTGIILTITLHTIQQCAFGGYSESSFREIVEHALPWRRLMVLVGCGAVVGCGWVGINRYGAKLVEIKTSVNDSQQQMPFKTTICHGFLQIVTVALGSPLGREVAPREISAALATKLMQSCHVDEHTRKLLLACASGAGLAAVYNVPLASAIFILETLLVDWSFSSLGAAMLCCGTAVYIVRLGIGDLVQYPLPQVGFNEMLILWAVVAGPIIALGVVLFEKSLKPFPMLSRKNPKMIVVAILCFTAIGFISMWFPEILGNGKAGNQLSFTFAIDGQYGLGLFIMKWIAVILATAAGAYGGRITPSMMLGGMLGLLLALCWNMAMPAVPAGMAAFVGAAVYLGLAQKMPLTAVVFLLELSRFSPAYLFPLCICMSTALLTFTHLKEKSKEKKPCSKQATPELTKLTNL